MHPVVIAAALLSDKNKPFIAIICDICTFNCSTIPIEGLFLLDKSATNLYRVCNKGPGLLSAGVTAAANSPVGWAPASPPELAMQVDDLRPVV